ncbi:MAG: DUF2207 family protein [Candidatus Faecivicinus sp.]
MKRSLRKILCFFLVMLTIPLLSLTAQAEDSSAELHSLHFDIALQEDGSALITETREIVFNGEREFTRYRVNNLFTGPRAFSDWQVSIDGTPVAQLDEPDNENRPENTFAVEDNDEGNTVHVYFRQQGDGTRIIRIGYRVENAVKLYSDVGEFFWNLTGESGISDIGTLTATLTVPADSPAEEFHIWAHGPLNGTFEKQPDGSAALQVDNVPLGTIVDVRSTLPAYCFTGGWEQQGEALDEILAEEKELADSANAKREEEARERAERDAYWAELVAKRDAWEAEHPILSSIEWECRGICDSVGDFMEEYGFVTPCVILLFSFPILALFGVFGLIKRIRHRNNLKKFRNSPTQSPRYCRDLPDDRPAPTVDKLLHFYDGKSSLSRQLSATLLELNSKKLVYFRTAAEDTELLLNEPLGEKLFPSPAPQESAEADQAHAAGYQEILWNYLLNAADESGRISMKDLKKYIKDNPSAALKFRSSFESAVEKEHAERVKSRDVERYSPRRWKLRLLLSAAAGIIAMLIHMLSDLYYGIEFVAAAQVFLITFAVAMILLIYFHLLGKCVKAPCYVLDQQGEDDLALWQAFKRFLDDFTTFEEKELPEFSIWREYMAYAVAMGSGQKVAKALSLKYPESSSTGTNTFDDDMNRWLQDMALYDAMDSLGREVAEIKAPSSSSSSSGDSSWSDSSGDGGGFSDSGGGSDSGSGGDFID